MVAVRLFQSTHHNSPQIKWFIAMKSSLNPFILYFSYSSLLYMAPNEISIEGEIYLLNSPSVLMVDKYCLYNVQSWSSEMDS